MNPILKKFSSFTEFTKYEYRDVSKPDQTITNKLKNFWFIYSNWKYKTTYIRDMISLTQKTSKEVPKWDKLKLSLTIYKLSDIFIGVYAVHSIFWHYKRNYFNSGRKLVELYIVTKIILNLFILNGFSFFSLKLISDPILYEYFSKKEEEWEENLKKKNQEIKDMREEIEMKMIKKEKSKM
jgi:hypothetical protein